MGTTSSVVLHQHAPVAPTPCLPPIFVPDDCQPWMAGPMSTAQAECALLADGVEEGCFLVREPRGATGFVLSIRIQPKRVPAIVEHLTIMRVEQRTFQIQLDVGGERLYTAKLNAIKGLRQRTFMSLTALVDSLTQVIYGSAKIRLHGLPVHKLRVGSEPPRDIVSPAALPQPSVRGDGTLSNSRLRWKASSMVFLESAGAIRGEYISDSDNGNVPNAKRRKVAVGEPTPPPQATQPAGATLLASRTHRRSFLMPLPPPPVPPPQASSGVTGPDAVARALTCAKTRAAALNAEVAVSNENTNPRRCAPEEPQAPALPPPRAMSMRNTASSAASPVAANAAAAIVMARAKQAASRRARVARRAANSPTAQSHVPKSPLGVSASARKSRRVASSWVPVLSPALQPRPKTRQLDRVGHV